MSMFVRTNSTIWESANQSDYKDSIVFIEDTKQICSNGVYYGNLTSSQMNLEMVSFNDSYIVLEPNKFYCCSDILSELEIGLSEDFSKMNTYFVQFICYDTCVVLPSIIKWKNNIIPEFPKSHIITIKIQNYIATVINKEFIDVIKGNDGLYYKFIDLGLKKDDGSPLLFADRNVGATSIDDPGLYFQWGDAEGHVIENNKIMDGFEYNWSVYKHCNGANNKLTKYITNSGYGKVDGKNILEPEDDAAYVHVGEMCRMPIREELRQLIFNNDIIKQFIDVDGNIGTGGSIQSSKLKGIRFVSNIKGYEGNSIFIPVAGYGYNSSVHEYNSGSIWSSTLGTTYSDVSRFLYFNTYEVLDSLYGRAYGRNVRAIK